MRPRDPRSMPIAVLLQVVVAVGLLVALRAVAAPGPLHFVPLLRLDAIPRESLGLAWSSQALWPADLQTGGLNRIMAALAGITASAICVAMLNVFILVADRAVSRGHEIAVRSALGAQPLRLVGMLLGEIQVPATSALVIGLLLGGLSGRMARDSWPGGPLMDVGGIRAAASLVVPLAAVAACLLAAHVGPAMRVARSMSVGDRLRVGFRSTGDAMASFFRNAAAVVHVSLAGALVIAGLSLSTFSVSSIAAGAGMASGQDSVTHDGSDFVVVQGTAPTPGAWRALLADIADIRGIAAEGLASPGALLGLGVRDVVTAECGECKWGLGPGIVIPLQSAVADHYAVTPDLLEVATTQLLSGRFFVDADASAEESVAIVNQTFAKSSFEHGNPLGKRISIGRGLGTWVTVVGVVETSRLAVLGQDELRREAVFLDARQHTPQYASLLLRGEMTAIEAVVSAMEEADFAPGAPVPLSTFRAQATATLSWLGRIVSAMAAVALALATYGVHTIAVQVTRRRAPELAIRRALGASSALIIRLVLRERLTVGLWGVAGMVFCGTIAVAPLRRATGLPMPGIPTYVGVASLLLVVSLLGSLQAAREATQVEPVELLK